MPGVTTVGDYAFWGCDSLASINIPLCTTVGKYAFYGCDSLTSINIPLCTTVKTYALRNCTSLSSIVLPDTLSRVITLAFGDCDNITTLGIVLRTPGRNNISTMCSSTLVDNKSYFALQADSTLNVYLGSELFDETSGVAVQDGWQSFLEGLFSLTKTGINSSWGSNITRANLYLNGTELDETTVSGYTGYPGIFTNIDYNTEQPYA